MRLPHHPTDRGETGHGRPRHHHHHHRHHRHAARDGDPAGDGPSGRHGPQRGGRGGPGGGGGRRRVFDSGELRLVLLHLLAEAPRHGYDLIRAIEARTGGAYAPSPGVIYPTVTLLQDMGQIAEAAADGARKAYAVTAEGAAHLGERRAEADALLARLDRLGTIAGRTDGGPVRRAMTNLRTVLHDRLGQADVGTATLHDVAAILDEAARRIERLGEGATQ